MHQADSWKDRKFTHERKSISAEEISQQTWGTYRVQVSKRVLCKFQSTRGISTFQILSPSPRVVSPSRNGETSSFCGGSISLLDPFLNAVGLRGLEVAFDLLYHCFKVGYGDFVAGTSCTAHIIP